MDYLERLILAMQEEKIDKKQVDICVSYAEKLLDKNLPVIFDVEHLYRILKLGGVKLDAYNSFVVEGRSKSRTIEAPGKNLKKRQRWILENILEKIPVSDNAHGFVKNRSIVSNAKCHVGQEYVLNMDIKNFFPTIAKDAIVKIFHDLGYTTPVSELLADICCAKGYLPQGAPTSPYLANVVCFDMDSEIQKLADVNNAIYTRYADDITFSYNEEIPDIVSEIERILKKYGFAPNLLKTHLDSGNRRKLVTGLLVNEQVRVPKTFKRKLKQEIYYCKKFGVIAHLENSGTEKCVNYREHLYGKAYYIKMVEPEAGEEFLNQLDDIRW